jgi:hypothetical protein
VRREAREGESVGREKGDGAQERKPLGSYRRETCDLVCDHYWFVMLEIRSLASKYSPTPSDFSLIKPGHSHWTLCDENRSPS